MAYCVSSLPSTIMPGTVNTFRWFVLVSLGTKAESKHVYDTGNEDKCKLFRVLFGQMVIHVPRGFFPPPTNNSASLRTFSNILLAVFIFPITLKGLQECSKRQLRTSKQDSLNSKRFKALSIPNIHIRPQYKNLSGGVGKTFDLHTSNKIQTTV